STRGWNAKSRVIGATAEKQGKYEYVSVAIPELPVPSGLFKADVKSLDVPGDKPFTGVLRGTGAPNQVLVGRKGNAYQVQTAAGTVTKLQTPAFSSFVRTLVSAVHGAAVEWWIGTDGGEVLMTPNATAAPQVWNDVTLRTPPLPAPPT